MIPHTLRLASRLRASTFGVPRPLAFRLTSTVASQSPPAKKILKSASFVKPATTDDFSLTRLIKGTTKLHIGITERASEKLTEISQQDNNPNSALEIQVESGGCHGFQYNLKVVDLDLVVEKARDEDTEDELLVFRREKEGQNAQIVLNEGLLEILQELKIDYVHELIGSQFKVVDLPYTLTACGCGASFDFDFEKLAKKKSEEGNNP